MVKMRAPSRALNSAKDILQKQPKAPSIFSANQDYLTGLRGIIVIESFLWLFFQTFIPGLVPNQEDEYDSPPLYQVVLRKLFSPLLWEPTLISSFFIILSARTLCIHFLQESNAPTFARTLISRPLRIGIPISIALVIAIAVFSNIDTSYISQAAYALKNPTLTAPAKTNDALVGFNSIFDLLWVYKDFARQMGNNLWPSATIWVISVIYYQSWTVFSLMVILPFARPGWHLQGMVLFGLGSWWFNTWGWYSAIGLLIADLSINPALRAALERGMKLPFDVRLPYWTFAWMLFAIGTVLKYIFVAAFPQHFNRLLVINPAQYLQPLDGLGNLDPTQPYPRLDNFLIVAGTLLMLETSAKAQAVVSWRVFKYFGRRSLSMSPPFCHWSLLTIAGMFVAQSLMTYTIGLKLFVYMYSKDESTAGAKAACFVVCLLSTVLGAEVFFRVFDVPAQWFGQAFFRWSRK